jgi:hypothetical protein
VTASPKRVSGRRAQLGAPVVPINSSGRYLRHRVAADEAYHSRRRALWWHRAALAVIAGLFYLAIGRDLLALARAKKDSAVMEIRYDTHQVVGDLQRIAGAANLASNENMSPLAFTSAQAMAAKGDPGEVQALLSSQPIETQSRAGRLK